jgi:molecular chaperone IbpA
MRTHDLSPLFRSSVGFDRMSCLLEAARKSDEQANGYPPYNIEKTAENAYRVTLAVAGFRSEELDITALPNQLVVRGKQADAEGGAQYLFRGIAGRSFERRFQLADHIRVGAARLDNGLLHIDLIREVPEAMKPRTIPISTIANAGEVLEAKAA